MTTKRFALDSVGKKIYIGTLVEFRSDIFVIEDMKYLSWSKEQFLTLRAKKNKHKILDYVPSNKVMRRYTRSYE